VSAGETGGTENGELEGRLSEQGDNTEQARHSPTEPDQKSREASRQSTVSHQEGDTEQQGEPNDGSPLIGGSPGSRGEAREGAGSQAGSTSSPNQHPPGSPKDRADGSRASRLLGSRGPTPTAVRGPTPTGSRGPTPTGGRGPTPTGGRAPTPTGGRGLPTPTGGRAPTPTGGRAPTPTRANSADRSGSAISGDQLVNIEPGTVAPTEPDRRSPSNKSRVQSRASVGSKKLAGGPPGKEGDAEVPTGRISGLSKSSKDSKGRERKSVDSKRNTPEQK